MLKKFCFLILFFFSWRLINPVLALEVDIPNNKFGIHLVQPHDQDLEAAASLVNSSGGDWGYVTLVIQENDRDYGKWQEIFNKLRRLHLIPIIRLATQPEGAIWQRPSQSDTSSWVDFLDSLNWVVKNRYVILFNEPNHASEWGGKVDPESYAEIAFNFAKALKEKNSDFFVMLAGFDAAAPHQPPEFEDETIFLKKIFNFKFLIFNFLDGWVSHSYPNPGYVGSPYDSGRNSIRNYQWELQLLKELGVTHDLPVFITETGWPHDASQKSKVESPKFYSPEIVAENMKIAFDNVWLADERIKAVTPFVLNYQGEPFAEFSWALSGREDFYPQYYVIQDLNKTKGEPEQRHKVTASAELPQELVERSTYNFKIKLKNEGQTILDQKESCQLSVISNQFNKQLKYSFSEFDNLEPFNEQTINFHLKTTDKLGKYKLKIGLFKNNKLLLDLFSWDFKVSPWPSLSFKIALFPKLKTEGKDFEIQIFDKNEQLVYKKKNIEVAKGIGQLERINNIALNEPYRVVILKPYYLPRQAYLVFKKDKNEAVFKKMLPLDFNRDGKFSFSDFVALVRNLKLLRLWWFF
jgi:hypothetical protein